jgi:hypothetical protein
MEVRDKEKEKHKTGESRSRTGFIQFFLFVFAVFNIFFLLRT